MKSNDDDGTDKPTRRTKLRGITENEELMTRGVLATFRHGGVPSYRPARLVAPEVGVSPQALHALLKAAFKKGLVSTLIHLPQERIDVARLEEAVRARYGLRKEVKTTHKGIGLGFEGLRAIAQDPEGEVVLICGGDRLRFEPLRVALEAKLASVLVSDTVTARYLVGELDETREVA